jgi:hypothetical protein
MMISRGAERARAREAAAAPRRARGINDLQICTPAVDGELASGDDRSAGDGGYECNDRDGQGRTKQR